MFQDDFNEIEAGFPSDSILTSDFGKESNYIILQTLWDFLCVLANIGSPWTCALWEHTSFTVASATDNVVCDSSVPSHMPAVAAAPHCGCHMRVCTEITTLVLQLTSINECLWWQFPVQTKLSQLSVGPSSSKHCSCSQTWFSSPHCLTWLKSPADSGDRGLQRRHLERRGGLWSYFRSQYKSPTPKIPAILGHWPTNKRLSQIHFATCLSALCAF